MNNKEILKVVEESLKIEGANISLSFDGIRSRREATDVINKISSQLKRTWQPVSHENLNWIEIVNHDDDRLEVSIFLE